MLFRVLGGTLVKDFKRDPLFESVLSEAPFNKSPSLISLYDST